MQQAAEKTELMMKTVELHSENEQERLNRFEKEKLVAEKTDNQKEVVAKQTFPLEDLLKFVQS